MEKNKMFKVADYSDLGKHKDFFKDASEKYPKENNNQSGTKMSEYSNNDFELIQIRFDMFYRKLASLMDKEPSDPEVQKVVADKRNVISNYFYNCTPEIYKGLGDLYVNDKRYSANIDKYKPGLANFERAAIYFYCDNFNR